jgi:hypothetical protein
MQGLQGIIRGCCTNVKITPITGGKKVSMSMQQARKKLKGQRKNLPQVPSLKDHMPPPQILSATQEIMRIATGSELLQLTLTGRLLQ